MPCMEGLVLVLEWLVRLYLPHIVGGVVYSKKVAETDKGCYPATEY